MMSQIGGVDSRIRSSSHFLPDSNVGYSVGVEGKVLEDSRGCVVGDGMPITLSLGAVTSFMRVLSFKPDDMCFELSLL